MHHALWSKEDQYHQFKLSKLKNEHRIMRLCPTLIIGFAMMLTESLAWEIRFYQSSVCDINANHVVISGAVRFPDQASTFPHSKSNVRKQNTAVGCENTGLTTRTSVHKATVSLRCIESLKMEWLKST